MINRIGTVLICGLTLAANVGAEEKSAQKKIQGKWKIESALHGGKAMPDEMTKSAILVIDGNKMKITMTANGKEQTVEMTFKLDPSKKPGAIDVDIDGKPGLGIYSLDGDTLKICHGEGDDPRPTEFASKEGTRSALIVFKRVK
jgi:uncharacterized protein (TIGR03067 family)